MSLYTSIYLDFLFFLSSSLETYFLPLLDYSSVTADRDTRRSDYSDKYEGV